MNEGIDIALSGAKIAASKNQAASIAIHALSASYNFAQMVRYQVLCADLSYAQLPGGIQNSMGTLEQYRRELIKHTILSGIDVLSLLLIGLSGLNKK